MTMHEIHANGSMNVAAELARLRGEMSTGFAEIKGQLGMIAQTQNTQSADIGDLQNRVAALEARRWPIGPLAAVSGVVSAVVAGAAFLVGR